MREERAELQDVGECNAVLSADELFVEESRKSAGDRREP